MGYQTMQELGFQIGDRVVWETPHHMTMVGGEFKRVHVRYDGVIIRDSSMYPTPSGERFVHIETDAGNEIAVSTLYLMRVPDTQSDAPARPLT